MISLTDASRIPPDRHRGGRADRGSTAADPDLAQLTDELTGVVDYLRKHQRVPAQVLRADVVDAIEILNHLHAELDRLRLATLRTGLRAGMTYSDLAEPLGVRTRQGAEAALRRLENAVAGGSKDEKAGRQDRKRSRQQTTWLVRHSAELRAIAVKLLDHRAEMPHLSDDLDDLATDLAGIPAGSRISAGFAAQLRLLVREATAPGTTPPPPLRETLSYAAARLASDPHLA